MSLCRKREPGFSTRIKVERLEKLEKIGTEDTEAKNTDVNVGKDKCHLCQRQKITVGLKDFLRSDSKLRVSDNG